MIRDFRPGEPLEPEQACRFQWIPAVASGLIAGVVVLVMPRGNPWSTLTFFSPMVLGRIVPPESSLSLPGAITIHLAGSILFGVLVSIAAARVTRLRAVFVGGAVGLLLYAINLGVVSAWFPELSGNEFSVAITHAVFGVIAGGAYRGLLRRSSANSRADGVSADTKSVAVGDATGLQAL